MVVKFSHAIPVQDLWRPCILTSGIQNCELEKIPSLETYCSTSNPILRITKIIIILIIIRFFISLSEQLLKSE
jgi:hypothetical protein